MNDPTGKIREGDRKPFPNLGAPAIPCGLVARSVFNDTYELYKIAENGVHVKIDIAQNDIAWTSDAQLNYANIRKD